MWEPIGEQELLDRNPFDDGRLKLTVPNGEHPALRKGLRKPKEV
jgi:hypothetical protein